MRRTSSRKGACSRALKSGTAAWLVLLLAACSPVTRHQVLTFFFTGVPPLEGEAAPEQPEAAPEPAAPARMGLPFRRAPEFWVHGPYGARACDACHATGQPGVPPVAGIPSGELCARCHTTFVAALRPGGERWIHGPVASGECIACHDPHRSPNRYMLRAAPEALCARCHQPSDVAANPAHEQADGVCLNCHDPHGGDTRAVLAHRSIG